MYVVRETVDGDGLVVWWTVLVRRRHETWIEHWPCRRAAEADVRDRNFPADNKAAWERLMEVDHVR